MPGDPKDCRRHAARCAELAVAARTPQLKAAFLGLSKNWEKLAIQLEDTFAKLAEDEALRSNVPPPWSFKFCAYLRGQSGRDLVGPVEEPVEQLGVDSVTHDQAINQVLARASALCPK